MSREPKDSDDDDYDIDNLLASLTATEVEQLESELVNICPDHTVPVGLRQKNQTDKKPSVKYNRAAMLDFCEKETKKLIQREMSVEGETKAEEEISDVIGESRDSTSSAPEGNSASNTDPANTDINRERPEDSQEELESQHLMPGTVACQDNDKERSQSKSPVDKESKEKTDTDSVVKVETGQVEVDVKGKSEELVKKGKSKTLDLISKLQRKSDTKTEKDTKEESRSRKDSKTKELISKLQGQRKTEERKTVEKVDRKLNLKESRIRGLFPNKDKVGELRASAVADVRDSEKVHLRGTTEPHERVRKLQKGMLQEKTSETSAAKTSDANKTKPSADGREPLESAMEENEDDSSGMFKELLERVRKNDPTLTELNVNNSDAIKPHTLIQLAEALRGNVHVKTLAMANTRADDHVAYAVAITLQSNTSLTSVNLDSNHITSKGILALIRTLDSNTAITELRFHNQRHIFGGKTEMEMTKILRNNNTLLKLGYHFELAGPRMTITNVLCRNMDLQRQRRVLEQKRVEQDPPAQPYPKASLQQHHPSSKMTQNVPPGILENTKNKNMSPLFKERGNTIETPLRSGDSLVETSKVTAKVKSLQSGKVPSPTPSTHAPVLGELSPRKALSPWAQKELDGQTSQRTGGRNTSDHLLDSIRSSAMKVLKKVDVPKRLR